MAVITLFQSYSCSRRNGGFDSNKYISMYITHISDNLTSY
jgi:hypothetical protein